jgi:hypothetical protein
MMTASCASEQKLMNHVHKPGTRRHVSAISANVSFNKSRGLYYGQLLVYIDKKSRYAMGGGGFGGKEV